MNFNKPISLKTATIAVLITIMVVILFGLVLFHFNNRDNRSLREVNNSLIERLQTENNQLKTISGNLRKQIQIRENKSDSLQKLIVSSKLEMKKNIESLSSKTNDDLLKISRDK